MAHDTTHSQVFHADARTLVALDWSFSAVHTTFDGATVARWADMGVFLDSLESPHKIVAESSFESWDPVRRLATIDRLRSAGHELYVFRPKYTSRLRTQLPDLVKSDENDTRLIYMIATNGKHHLYPVPSVDQAWVSFRADANKEWGLCRLTAAKKRYEAAAVAVLGPYGNQSTERQLALGNGRAYSPTLLAVLYFCAQRCATRNEFERLVGLHGSAYPSLLRSEVHNHSMKHARNRGVGMSMYRREVRRAWRELRNAVLVDQTTTR